MGWEVSNYRYLKLTAEVKQKEYLPVRQYIPSTQRVFASQRFVSFTGGWACQVVTLTRDRAESEG